MIEVESDQQEQTSQQSTAVSDPAQEQQPENPEQQTTVTVADVQGTDTAGEPITIKQLEELLNNQAYGAYAHVDTVVLPNGTSFNFAHQLTLGDLLVSSAIFLLVAFQVIKWLLNTLWERRA